MVGGGGGLQWGCRAAVVCAGGGLCSGPTGGEGKLATRTTSRLFCSIEVDDVVPSLVLLRLPSTDLCRVSPSPTYSEATEAVTTPGSCRALP